MATMKTAKSLLLKCLVAGVLLLAVQSHALTTPYLINLSNQVAGYQAMLAGSPDPAHQKEARALARALRDLTKPTTTVAQDYDRYFLAVLHLGDYAFSDPNLSGPGVAVFQLFMNDAGAKIMELSLRTNVMSEFVSVRKAASKNIDQAMALLIANSTETNLQTGLLRGRRIFSKLVAAERLVVKGEARPGFAPHATHLSSRRLEYTERDGSGAVNFTNDEEYTQEEGEEVVAGTYTYTRTGLHTATVVLSEIGGNTTTVKLKFRSTGGGRYTFTAVEGEDSSRGAGSFTITAPPS
jgi:hypothetical protein